MTEDRGHLEVGRRNSEVGVVAPGAGSFRAKPEQQPNPAEPEMNINIAAKAQKSNYIPYNFSRLPNRNPRILTFYEIINIEYLRSASGGSILNSPLLSMLKSYANMI
jgi:hypothetical protein